MNKLTPLSLGLIILLTICTLFSQSITKYDPIMQGDLLKDRYLSPSWDHLFGTDKFGRDVFSRVLYGARISLAIAFGVVMLTITIGLLYGTVAGYFGGKTDAVMMRILDFLLAFPAIFLIIAIISVFQGNHWFLILILGLTGWMETARIVRADVLSLKEREFILAAKGLGFNHARIILHHIIPNCFHLVIVTATLKIGEVILLESALSFLGIGVQPPTPSLGNIINDGRAVLLRAWWVSTFPGFFIVLFVISFNLLGEGLRNFSLHKN